MRLSDEMMMVLAKAINNGGSITHSIVNSVYSSADKSKFRNVLLKLQTMGHVRAGTRFGTFFVRVKESKTKNKLLWIVPVEVLEIANNLRISNKEIEKEEELLKKYRK